MWGSSGIMLSSPHLLFSQELPVEFGVYIAFKKKTQPKPKTKITHTKKTPTQKTSNNKKTQQQQQQQNPHQTPTKELESLWSRFLEFVGLYVLLYTTLYIILTQRLFGFRQYSLRKFLNTKPWNKTQTSVCYQNYFCNTTDLLKYN